MANCNNQDLNYLHGVHWTIRVSQVCILPPLSKGLGTRLAPQVRSYVYMYTHTLIICSSYVALIGVHEMHGQVHPINDM